MPQSQTDSTMTALVVLGKALQDGRISCEFALRIAAAVHLLATHRERYHCLYFIGGKGEARAAVDCYRDRYGHLFVDLPTATEEQSVNTVENVGALTAMLNRNGPARVDLLSNDYHLERLRAIHTHLPGQSLLQPLAPYLGELVPVPCFFDRFGNLAQQQQARLYRMVDRLNFPRANIEGVLAGRQALLLPWALMALADVIESLLRVMLRQVWEPEFAAAVADAQVELTAIQCELTTGADPQNLSRQKLSELKLRLDSVMARLRHATDPDCPASAADWLAIERWLAAGQCRLCV